MSLNSAAINAGAINATASGAAYFLVSETLNLSETITSDYGFTVSETLSLNPTIVSSAIMYVLAQDSVEFQGLLRFAFDLQHSDTLNLTETVTAIPGWKAAVADTLLLSETYENAAFLYTVITSILELAESLGYGFEDLISDTLNLSQALVSQLIAQQSETSTLQFSEVISQPRLSLFLTDGDVLSFNQSIQTNVTIYETLSNILDFSFVFSDGNEIYTGWVMNTRNKAVTSYTNYKFNSFGKVGSLTLAASSQGLYQLSGSTDAGTAIVGRLLSGRFDPSGEGHQSRVESMYLGIDTTDKVVVKVIDGAGVERWYESTAPRSNGLETLRTKLGRGVKSRYWQFEIRTKTAELESIELLPVVLSRKVR